MINGIDKITPSTRPTAGSGEDQLESDDRFLTTTFSLTISMVQDGDQGSYICALTNPAGEDRAMASLVIFGEAL